MQYRNFSFDAVSDNELEQRAAELLANRLTNRWNEIEEELERKHYQAQDEYYVDREQDFLESILSDADDPDDGQAAVDAYLASKHQRELSLILEQQTIQDQLAAIGARIVRPYEHWNEEESYREFIENAPSTERYR
jgi:predicted phage gp36 major capsid-like protein